MDQFGVEWQYEPRRFNLGWTTYMPDFYLPEFNIWLEVKGWMMEEARKKIESFRSMGYSLTIVTKEQLVETSKFLSTRVGG